jgi:CelD/BcsL family acetyltransferase involved in cellulose biosynthesis
MLRQFLPMDQFTHDTPRTSFNRALGEFMLPSPSTPMTISVNDDRPSASMVFATEEDSAIRTLPYWPSRSANPMDDFEFRRRWLDGLTNSLNGTIYLHPDLVLPLGNPQGNPLVYTWRAETDADSGSPIASLAVLAARSRRIQPLPGIPWRVHLRERYLVGNQVAGENSIESMTPFVEGVRQLVRSGEADSVFFADLEVDSGLWNLLGGLKSDPDLAVFYPSRPQARWRLRFPENPTDYWKQFSRKNRETFRRRRKQLSQQWTCYREPAEVGTFLKKAEAVSQKSWQTQFRGLQVSADPEQQRHWERIAALGAMRSYILEHDGQPVAFELCIQWNGTFVGVETGYDLALARFSPGTVLILRMLEDLIAQDTPRLIDLGGGDYGYKQLFCNEQTFSGRVLLVRRAFKPLLAARLRSLVQMITELARSGLYRSKTLTRLARKWRHRGMS